MRAERQNELKPRQLSNAAVARLEEAFSRDNSSCCRIRAALAVELKLNSRQIRTWLQRKRRLPRVASTRSLQHVDEKHDVEPSMEPGGRLSPQDVTMEVFTAAQAPFQGSAHHLLLES